MPVGAVVLAALIVATFLFWRYVWFFRDPPRQPPAAEGILSPADGTVVYVRKIEPREDVIVIKQGVQATIRDILREDADATKLVIGIFMSPFDVHYNRAPIRGRLDFIRRHPAVGENVHMGAMHWRTLFNIAPHYAGSMHIIQNERAVTHFVGRYRDEPLSCYVVQIGARTVNGIDSYFRPGDMVERGATFGMIRIGSQVDLIVAWRPGFKVLVRSGERVRAGETRLIE
jgi:phosphatidylserine decarboxylase